MDRVLSCAKQLLKNTSKANSGDLEYFIEDYEEFGKETGCSDMLMVLEMICEDGFDISNFGLYDIPNPSVYMFYDSVDNKMFNICIEENHNFDKYAYISYIDHENNICIAKSIPIAIKNYNRIFTP